MVLNFAKTQTHSWGKYRWEPVHDHKVLIPKGFHTADKNEHA